MFRPLQVIALVASLCLGAGAFNACSADNFEFDVYLAPPIPIVFPNTTNLTWSPIAFTLIHGKNEAVLVDAPPTEAQAVQLADWIDQTIPGKRLTTAYITHGHGDHFFGFAYLQQRYPGLKVLATQSTIDHVNEEFTPEIFGPWWEVLFPNQIPKQTTNITALEAPRNEFFLEGHVLHAVEVVGGDAINSTVLHVPDLDLIVGGDVVYGHCFPYLSESNTPELRSKWIDALEDIKSLYPKFVVPAHHQSNDTLTPAHLQQTQDFIRAWDEEVAKTNNSATLQAEITKRFPDFIGEFILYDSAINTVSN